MKHTTKKDILKVFSNHNRVRLIMCLSTAKSVTELLSLCDLSQSALSQHLKVLKDAGVATCKREGKMQIYSVTNKKVITVAKLLLEIGK